MVQISTAKNVMTFQILKLANGNYKLILFSPVKPGGKSPFPDLDISHAREGSSASFLPAVLCFRTVCEPGRGKLPGFTLCHFERNRSTCHGPNKRTSCVISEYASILPTPFSVW